MQTRILYYWLGLQDKYNKSSAEEIRESYRRLVALYHPERTKETADSLVTRRWQEVQLAYKILSNEITRKRYDQGLIDDLACCRCLDSRKPHQTPQDLQTSLKATQSNMKRVARTYQTITADLPFFFHTAYYVFLSSSLAAQTYQPLLSANIPLRIYVTTASLRMLSLRIQEITQIKPIFKPQAGDGSPAHLVMKTNYPPALERLIDTLMLENMLFEQYQPSTEGHSYALERNAL